MRLAPTRSNGAHKAIAMGKWVLGKVPDSMRCRLAEATTSSCTMHGDTKLKSVVVRPCWKSVSNTNVLLNASAARAATALDAVEKRNPKLDKKGEKFMSEAFTN